MFVDDGIWIKVKIIKFDLNFHFKDWYSQSPILLVDSYFAITTIKIYDKYKNM